MSIQSMDQLISALSLGQAYRSDWNKNFNPTTLGAIGEWNIFGRGGGTGGAEAIFNTGTNLTFNPLTDATASSGAIPHGGAVSPAYKHILNASAFSAAGTSAPTILMLIDIVGWYRITTTTLNTSQTMVNTLSQIAAGVTCVVNDVITHGNINIFPYTRIQFTTSGTLPTGLSTVTDYYVIKVTDTTCKVATSYANAVAGTAVSVTSGTGSGTHNIVSLYSRYTSGAGLQSIWFANNATPLGAGVPNLSYPAYTNSQQTGSRTTPAVLPVGKTAANSSLIIYSGTGVGKYGPFFPLASGDSGIAKIDNMQLSATYTSGEFSIAIVKPLLVLPITTQSVAAERDLVNQIPSMPRIYDGAALYWLQYNGAATPVNTAYSGHLDFAWN